MKKFFIHIYMLAAAVLLAASCETPLFIEPVGEECQTVLQARLLTSDSLHTVHASYSLHDSVIPADDLTIRCFVNGQLEAETSEASREHIEYDTTKDKRAAYRFRASIHPGDSVRIEAAGPHGVATARLKAPDALPAPEVTWDNEIRRTESGSTYSVIRFRINVNDIPAQRNWYRISARARQVVNEYDHSSYPIHEGWYKLIDREMDVDIDNTGDPLLNPDGREVEKWRKDYMANKHNFFTDELFEDGSNVLNLAGLASDYKYLTNMGFTSYCDYMVNISAIFDLQSLTREDYLYSRMLEMDNFSLSGIGIVDRLFSEDAVLPDNVDGGIGLVSVRSVTRVTCDLGTFNPDINSIFDYDNWPPVSPTDL